jgi:hypothetical protein
LPQTTFNIQIHLLDTFYCSHITTTMSVANGSDYEHWPDDATQFSTTAPSVVYDSYNGLREYRYEPANDEKKDDKKKIEPAPAAEVPATQQTAYAYQPGPPPQYYQGMPYACYPNQQFAAYPAPAYYGLPPQAYGFPPGYPQGFLPAPAAPREEVKVVEKRVKKKAEPMKWQGRTKAEVEEDNMRIAAKEGAYMARKVEPIGLTEDQPVWVVLGDGSHSLR